MENLDYICMKYAQEIVNTVKDDNLENNLSKALGVLQEDGIYAMFLWLEDKDKELRKNLNSLLNHESIKKYLQKDKNSNFPDDFKEFCNTLKDVLKDLDNLFFIKKILDRTLTYALYHVRTGAQK